MKRDYDSWEWDHITIDTARQSLEKCIGVALAALAAKLDLEPKEPS
jgi:hypothetical protein